MDRSGPAWDGQWRFRSGRRCKKPGPKSLYTSWGSKYSTKESAVKQVSQGSRGSRMGTDKNRAEQNVPVTLEVEKGCSIMCNVSS